MNDIINFMISNDMIIVYIVIAIAIVLALVIYIIDKGYDRRKRKHNTKELNKLVEEIEEVTGVHYENNEEVVDPMLTKIEDIPEFHEVKAQQVEKVEVKEFAQEEQKVEIQEQVPPTSAPVAPEITIETIEELDLIEENSEELNYTTIEPNQEEAQKELERLTKELEKAEEQAANNNIELTKYEEEQEENAIISMDELLERTQEITAKNEIYQYKDEGNEPISIADLELRKQTKTEPEIKELKIETNGYDEYKEEHMVKIHEAPKVVVKEEKKHLYKGFKKSPIISPIYGLKKQQDMEFENTANYEKLDKEMKKTNEFLVALKELQKKLKE